MGHAMKMMFSWAAIEKDSLESGKMIPLHGSFSQLPELGNYRFFPNKDLLCIVEYYYETNEWHGYIYVPDDDFQDHWGLLERSGMFKTRIHAMTWCDVQLCRVKYREFKPKHLNLL